jgi:hypothetical protein
VAFIGHRIQRLIQTVFSGGRVQAGWRIIFCHVLTEAACLSSVAWRDMRKANLAEIVLG